MITTELQTEVVQAIDALNSYARHNNAHSSDGLIQHIYNMKSRLIARMRDAGQVVNRSIKVQMPCRTCGGTGIFRTYYDRYGQPDYHSPCRNCSETGKVWLHFIEHTICQTLWGEWSGREVVWHSPTSRKTADAVTVENWKPRTPGQALPVEKVAAMLNVAEPGLAMFDSYYRLYLGNASGDNCSICGKDRTDPERPAYLNGMQVSVDRKRLCWSGGYCDSCWLDAKIGAEYGHRPESRIPSPPIFAHPDVQAWITRKGGRAECMKMNEREFGW